jgi:alpha-galactosidase
MKFVPLPKATFYMGWDGEQTKGVKTEIKEDFEIAVHTVTQGQWQAVMGNNPSGMADIHAADPPQVVKVFILAGQSNMEGKAPNALLEHQATDPKTKELFAHLRKDDKWIVRDDVFVKFLDRHGPLTIGFGSPGRTGVELEFGHLMGNHFDEPVILIKAAWGGHSLYKNFRSPSAGYPADEVLQKELDQMQANVKKSNEKNKKNAPLPTMDDVKKQYGVSYRNMMAEVKDVMDNYGKLFPALKGTQKLEVAGFVWFQGWNDQYGSQDEYASNMKHFINDVRKDLGVPKLPFVIGVMGQNGSKPAGGAMLTIQKAQLSMNDIAEFKGNVKAIRTDVLVDKAAEELYPTWQKNLEQWKLVGGDHPYHYLGSAIWFNRIGKAMGEAMLELMKDQKAVPGLTIRASERIAEPLVLCGAMFAGYDDSTGEES